MKRIPEFWWHVGCWNRVEPNWPYYCWMH